MASKRKDIISDIVTKLKELADLNDDTVFTRPLLPDHVNRGALVVSVVRVREGYEDLDDNQVRCTLDIEVGVATKTDPGGSDDAEAQMDEVYDAVAAKLEELQYGNNSIEVIRGEGELAWDVATDPKQTFLLRSVSRGWQVIYERALQGTQ